VLILVDDFGYECVAANGGTSYRTPHLDKLAAGGMRFEHCHVQPLCTPTRVQLMTGLYNVRNYTHFGHLERGQTTFAHLFKRAGYATCIAGKWQLGRDMLLPGHFGFESYCLWQLNRRPPRYANPGLEIDGREMDFSHGEYGPDVVNAYALDYIERHKNQPFFLYYPMMLTHSPFQPTPDSPDWDPKAIGEQVYQNEKHFGDMVTYADKLVGTVVAALDKHGLRDNTLLIVLGDNGTNLGVPSQMGERTVIGGKGTSKLTGTHVPLIVNWPSVVKAGQVSGDLVDSTDFLPTICAATGVALPRDLHLDGRSFLPQLRGERGDSRQWIYCWYGRDGGPMAEAEFAMNKHYKLYRDGMLFDLQKDPGELAPLSTATLGGDAVGAQKLLGSALGRYRGARPAAIAAQGGPPEGSDARAKKTAE
jgi:arylsulfatase A